MFHKLSFFFLHVHVMIVVRVYLYVEVMLTIENVVDLILKHVRVVKSILILLNKQFDHGVVCIL